VRQKEDRAGARAPTCGANASPCNRLSPLTTHRSDARSGLTSSAAESSETRVEPRHGPSRSQSGNTRPVRRGTPDTPTSGRRHRLGGDRIVTPGACVRSRCRSFWPWSFALRVSGRRTAYGDRLFGTEGSDCRCAVRKRRTTRQGDADGAPRLGADGRPLRSAASNASRRRSVLTILGPVADMQPRCYRGQSTAGRWMDGGQSARRPRPP
jgi:hypothetical protein